MKKHVTETRPTSTVKDNCYIKNICQITSLFPEFDIDRGKHVEWYCSFSDQTHINSNLYNPSFIGGELCKR